jgi:hypothetical protein
MVVYAPIGALIMIAASEEFPIGAKAPTAPIMAEVGERIVARTDEDPVPVKRLGAFIHPVFPAIGLD